MTTLAGSSSSSTQLSPKARPAPLPLVRERGDSEPAGLLRSVSAPVSPVSPPWTPPRRRRIASAEPGATSWLDVQLVVDVVKDKQGCRELHCYLQVWDHALHVAVSFRRLLFWLALLLVLLPSSAFQLAPRMPSMATAATITRGATTALAVPTRLSRLDNITSLNAVPVGVAAISSIPFLESTFEAEALVEEIDACILDADSAEDISACLQQVGSSSLDELSGVIVKEGCNLFGSADDGTAYSMIGHLLHTVKAEGLEALELVSLRRMAVRMCVSVSMHKVTACALPAITACMMHASPDLAHAVNTIVS